MAASDNHLVTLSGLDKFKECMGETIHVITSCSGTAGSTASGSYNRTRWTGTISGVTSLYDGLIIQYKVPIAGVSRGVTLNVSSLGEHPVVLNANSMATTHYPVGTQLILTYDSTATCSVYVNNVSTSFTGCWKLPEYDSNTTYSAGTAALLTEGTDTSNRVWPASVLASYVTGKVPQSLLDLPYTNGSNRTFAISESNSGKNVDVGWNWTNQDGSGFALRSTDDYSGSSGDTSSGGVVIWARGRLSPSSETIATKQLHIKPSGLFQFDGKNIVLQDSSYTGTASDLTTGTGTTASLWTPQVIANYVTGKIPANNAAASGGTTLSVVTTGEKYTWNNKSNLAIGTTASTAAAGNHTHTTSLATDSGTSTVNMAANTTYKLTAGGTSVIFKTPADNNTNTTYKLTIGSTTYGDSGGTSLGTLTRGTATSGGTTLSLVNTGDMYTWNNKQNAITFNSTYNASTNKAATMTDVNTKATKASITAGTAGTSSATSGATIAIPYVTMSAEGVVTGYGTHIHTITGFAPSGGSIVNYVIGNMNVSSVATSLTADGSETIIYNNTGSSTITVSFATGDYIVFIDGNDCMEIPAGGYGEVNFLRIGGLNNVVHVFVRSTVSE